MTTKELVTNLLATLNAGVAGTYDAALDLVEIKRKSKKSFTAMGLTEQEVALVNDTIAAGPAVADVLEAAATDKMPAGVHKLTNMPKGNNVKGKVWTDVTVVLPSGSSTVQGRVETKRGSFVYFYVGEQGYRAVRERFATGANGEFMLNERVSA